MPIKVELHPSALTEAEAAARWYRDRDARLALAFASEVERVIALIEAQPLRWPEHLEGTRRILLRRFPFMLVYRVREADVLIVAVAHGRRRPGYWVRRR